MPYGHILNKVEKLSGFAVFTGKKKWRLFPAPGAVTDYLISNAEQEDNINFLSSKEWLCVDFTLI